CRAGRHGREVRPCHPELDSDLPRADIGDAHRVEERADPVRTGDGVGRETVDERPDSPEAGPEDHPRPLREFYVEPLGEARPVERFARGEHTVLAETID